MALTKGPVNLEIKITLMIFLFPQHSKFLEHISKSIKKR